MWKLGMTSGLLLGSLITFLAMQFAITRVHELPYWLDQSGTAWLELADCMDNAMTCNRKVGWFIE